MIGWKAWWTSCALGALFGLAGAMATAVVIGIHDLGRGSPDRPRLDREWIAVPEWGVFMSRADVAVLAAGALVAMLATLGFRALLRIRARNRQ